MPNPQFSQMVERAAKKMRNAFNAKEVKDFCSKIAAERFADAPDEHRAALEQWLTQSGSRWLVANGRAKEIKKLPETAPEWALKALREGDDLLAIELDGEVSRQLAHIADYLRTNIPRQLNKLSFEQAIVNTAAEDQRILRQKNIEEDADGVETLTSLPIERLGARWTRVKSAQALNREGSLMGHCVGSYAAVVANAKTVIYSLRDAENKPLVTVEARPCSKDMAASVAHATKWSKKRAKRALEKEKNVQFTQIRAAYNAVPDTEQMRSVVSLMDFLESRGERVISSEYESTVFHGQRRGSFYFRPDSPRPRFLEEAHAGEKIGGAFRLTSKELFALPEDLHFDELTLVELGETDTLPAKLSVDKLIVEPGVRKLDVRGWAVKNVEIANPYAMAGASLQFGAIESIISSDVQWLEARNSSFKISESIWNPENALAKLSAQAKRAKLPWLRARVVELSGGERLDLAGLEADELNVEMKEDSRLDLRFARAKKAKVSGRKGGWIDFSGANFESMAEEGVSRAEFESNESEESRRAHRERAPRLDEALWAFPDQWPQRSDWNDDLDAEGYSQNRDEIAEVFELHSATTLKQEIDQARKEIERAQNAPKASLGATARETTKESLLLLDELTDILDEEVSAGENRFVAASFDKNNDVPSLSLGGTSALMSVEAVWRASRVAQNAAAARFRKALDANNSLIKNNEIVLEPSLKEAFGECAPASRWHEMKNASNDPASLVYRVESGDEFAMEQTQEKEINALDRLLPPEPANLGKKQKNLKKGDFVDRRSALAAAPKMSGLSSAVAWEAKLAMCFAYFGADERAAHALALESLKTVKPALLANDGVALKDLLAKSEMYYRSRTLEQEKRARQELVKTYNERKFFGKLSFDAAESLREKTKNEFFENLEPTRGYSKSLLGAWFKEEAQRAQTMACLTPPGAKRFGAPTTLEGAQKMMTLESASPTMRREATMAFAKMSATNLISAYDGIGLPDGAWKSISEAMVDCISTFRADGQILSVIEAVSVSLAVEAAKMTPSPKKAKIMEYFFGSLPQRKNGENGDENKDLESEVDLENEKMMAAHKKTEALNEKILTEGVRLASSHCVEFQKMGFHFSATAQEDFAQAVETAASRGYYSFAFDRVMKLYEENKAPQIQRAATIRQ